MRDADVVGAKASGLASIPADWVPGYIVLPPEFVAWAASARLTSGRQVQDELDARLAPLAPSKYLIVRSSATLETLAARGRFQSAVVAWNSTGMIDVMRNLYELASAFVSGTEKLSLVIQRFVPPLMKGHLSNERRVAQRAKTWLVESYDPSGNLMDTARINAFKDPEAAGPLRCSTSRELQTCFREVAGYFLVREARWHLEWVWDGRRLWIVQADHDQDLIEPPPGSFWAVPPAPLVAAPTLEAFVPDTAAGDWHKLECVRLFRQLGLPNTSLFVLEDPTLLGQLFNGSVPAAVRRDLRVLAGSPFVIRTDVRYGDDLLCPRTHTVMGQEDAVGFLASTAMRFAAEGVAPEMVCFILHRFIPARASAWAVCGVDPQTVRIDGSWGLPDGLAYFPHDSFQVDLRTESFIKRVRCKDVYLDCAPDGTWVPRRAGTKYDWAQSISEDDLLAIAHMTARIADSLGKAVQVMFFVGVDGRSGHPRLMPWFYTDKVSIELLAPTSPFHYGTARTIEGLEDLDAVVQALEQSGTKGRPNLRLRPQADLFRDTAFLERVASTAVAFGVAVELEGSTLHHAFYLLRRAGANIRCIDAFAPPAERRQFGKLVRDRVAERIAKGGERVEAYVASRIELDAFLRRKLVEEALEVLRAESQAELREELADVLEVLESLAELGGTTMADVSVIAQRKREGSGGFRHGVVLVETTDLDEESSELDDTLWEDEGAGSLITIRRSGAPFLSVPKRQGRTLTLPYALPPSTHVLSEEGGRATIVRYLPDGISVEFGRPYPFVPVPGQERLPGSW